MNPKNTRLVIEPGAGILLLHQPEKLLRIGQRKLSAIRNSSNWRSSFRSSQLINNGGQMRDRRFLEEGQQGQVNMKHFADANNHFHRLQRITPDIEEVGVLLDV